MDYSGKMKSTKLSLQQGRHEKAIILNGGGCWDEKVCIGLFFHAWIDDKT
jgi:hypothetical protein